MNATNGTTNSTIQASPHFYIYGPKWDFMSGFYVIIIISALTINASVLLAFLCCPSLRTAFNIYLMNLLVANIGQVLLQNIPDLFNRLYSVWWLGDSYCTVLIFGLYFLEAGVQNCHILIAINRIWAVFWPHAYRNVHNRKVALLLCLAGWVEVCAMVLPGIVLDSLYHRTDPVKNGCRLNIAAQWKWSVVVQFLVYNMGIELMWIVYPIIWYKRRQTQKTAPSASRRLPVCSGTEKITATNAEIAADRCETRVRTVQPVNSIFGKPKRSSKAFMILTVLTISVTICWTPVHVLYTIFLWVPYDSINPLFLNIALVLFSLQSLIDPILFVCTLQNLRDSFRKIQHIGRT